MSTTYRKKLIEVSLPLEAINAASAREKSIRHGHPSTLHLWWARRPLAAARAILFAQLVDDPSSWLELFSTEEAQNHERQRLFRLIEDMVLWENSNDDGVINAARREIARSHARSSSTPMAKKILADTVKPEDVNEYLATEVPPVHDPFAGGGTIPLEAQRLGLRAIATDLNPVAVMINKALIEIPPKFAGMPPVNPDSRAKNKLKTWKGAEGLAEDVRYYGAWLRSEAWKRVGHLYPEVQLPKEHGGGKGTVIAWLWARTVESPNPAFKGCHVPLVSSFWLSQKPGKETWLEPVTDSRSYQFVVRTGKPKDATLVGEGTKLGRGANFRCILSQSPIEPDYIKAEGTAKRMGMRMMAAVVEGKRSRIYLPPTEDMNRAVIEAVPDWVPDDPLPDDPRNFWTVQYGLKTFGDLFTARQLVGLGTLSKLVLDAAEAAESDVPGDRSAEEYGSAIALMLGFALDKVSEASSTICTWSSAPKNELVVSTFRRQSLPMTWDFAESNPFADSSGSFERTVATVARAVGELRGGVPGVAAQRDARLALDDGVIVSTDPPYFDNITYGDLSDYLYVWLRHTLHKRFPRELSTVLVPKRDELVATPYRHGGKEAAEQYFVRGMKEVLSSVQRASSGSAPSTIYYAFKQSESDGGNSASTGWETFLEALMGTGFVVVGTLPVRTERAGRSTGIDTNALASSIVLVCRKRSDDATTTTRGDFRRLLRKELPDALKKLQQGNIAPVDVAQASIGPGMAIFSRHKQVVEADGKPMTVRSALQLINEVLDEYLSSGEGDFDADTRFAITWYEQFGWEPGPFGDAETLAKARNVSVKGVEEAGICKSAASKVRILKRSEMRPLDYDPAADERPTIWEFTQHMIRNLEDEGEEAAARLLKKLGAAADATRELAYRLYNTCERKKWAEDARSYNALILAWTELEKLASRMGDAPPPPAAPSNPGAAKKNGAKTTKAPKKGQQTLFEGDE